MLLRKAYRTKIWEWQDGQRALSFKSIHSTA